MHPSFCVSDVKNYVKNTCFLHHYILVLSHRNICDSTTLIDLHYSCTSVAQLPKTYMPVVMAKSMNMDVSHWIEFNSLSSILMSNSCFFKKLSNQILIKGYFVQCNYNEHTLEVIPPPQKIVFMSIKSRTLLSS